MRLVLASIVCASVALLCGGCVVYSQPAVVAEPVQEPVAEGPVIEGPGVIVIEQEPPPVERVYVYDPGYPPGAYFYGGYYYYGGYRYERDVFVTRYVNVNVRERRYVNVNENRSAGRHIEERHRTEFAQTGGVRSAPNHSPAYHGDANPNVNHRATPVTAAPHPYGQQAPKSATPHAQPQPHPQPYAQQTAPRQQGGRNAQQEK
jgi:hypothetical protein